MDVSPAHIAPLHYHSGALRPNPPRTNGGNGRHVARNKGILLSGSLVIVSVLSKDLSIHKRNNLDMQISNAN